MKTNFNTKQKGFTLVELLVSIAIFAMVLIVVLATIISIIDVNKKARSLSLVMNNLDFAIDSMTRSIKTANEIISVSVDKKTITLENQNGKNVVYTLNNGAITRNVDDDGDIDVTSPDVQITDLSFNEFGVVKGQDQPRILINIKGVANVSPTVTSDFDIQTTVSMRNLNLDDGNG